MTSRAPQARRWQRADWCCAAHPGPPLDPKTRVYMCGLKRMESGFLEAFGGAAEKEGINLAQYVKDSSEIGNTIRNLFLSGEVDKVEFLYSKFYKLLKSEPTVCSVLLLAPTGVEDPEDETLTVMSEDGKLKVGKEEVKSTKAKDIEPDVIFDQSPTTILNSILPPYLYSQLLSILLDAQASELSSWMTAMKAATGNVADLAKRFITAFERKQQTAITQELCEISAGAVSLEGKEAKGGAALGVFDNEDTVGDKLMAEIEAGVPQVPPEPEGPDARPKLTMDERFC